VQNFLLLKLRVNAKPLTNTKEVVHTQYSRKYTLKI